MVTSCNPDTSGAGCDERRIVRVRLPVRARTQTGRRQLALYALGLVLAFLAGGYAKWKHWDWIVNARIKSALAAIPTVPDQAREYIESVAAERTLPVVSLEIKPKHVRKLVAKREAALCDGVLQTSDDDYVPARMTHAGKSFAVKMRLKGGRMAHLRTDKWSLRVKVKGDERPLGMRTFSLQHPMTRYYLHEWGFLENLRREGVLAVRYQFVRLILNGEDRGIYALEEHFSKELLESHGRREGVIVAFDDSGYWRGDGGHRRWFWWRHEADERGWRWEDWDITTRLSTWRVQDLRTFDTRRVKRSATLRAQRDTAIELLRAYQEGRREAREVFDVELMGRYMALVDLWRAWHALLWQNTRYYYNPITARLEPIGFDAMPMWGDSEVALAAGRLDDRSVNGPLRDPRIARVYLHELERVSDPAYLAKLRAALEPEFQRWRRALRREFRSEPKGRIGSDLAPPWDKLAQRQTYIRQAIRTDRTVIASATGPVRGYSGDGDKSVFLVELRNITVLPVEVVGFHVGSGPLIPASSVWLQRRQIGVWENGDGSVGIVASGLDELRFKGSEVEPVILATFAVPVPTTAPRKPKRQGLDIEVATRFPGQGGFRWSKVRRQPPRSSMGPGDNIAPPANIRRDLCRVCGPDLRR